MGSIAYLILTRERKSEEQNKQVNYKEEVQQLQIQLGLLKSQLSSLPDANKKIQLESKISFLENYMNDLVDQKNYDKLTY